MVWKSRRKREKGKMRDNKPICTKCVKTTQHKFKVQQVNVAR